jgi:peptidase E
MSVAPLPIHLLAGGGWRALGGRDPLLAPILAQAGKERPTIAYIGAASNDDRTFFLWLSRYFKKGGAGDVRLAALSSKRADPDKARAIIASADLVFISGGDVEVGMQCLEAREIIPLLKKLYAGGKPFFGISAGSIMLANGWVRWSDPDDDATAETYPCLGLAPILCDTHAEKDDWEELQMLLKLSAPGHGYGIPSGGALRVDPDGGVAALGKPVARFQRRKSDVVALAPLMPA